MSATKSSIISLPNLHLRQKSARVHIVTNDTLELIKDMESATLDWEDSRPHELGVALAAVQIDRLERVIIIRNDFDNRDDRSFIALINPEIIKREGTPEYDHEGCLSVRDIYGLVPRHPKVRIRAKDLHGNDVRLKADGFLARILQHEIDHTNGILFVDHLHSQDAFFELDAEGKLNKLDYEVVEKTGILR